MVPKISVITPTYNEAASIETFLAQFHQSHEKSFEVIVVDSSQDDTFQKVADFRRSASYPLHLFRSEAGRARQMNMGATHAKSKVLLFLHADTFLPVNAFESILNSLSEKVGWGGFYIQFDPENIWLKLISIRSNARVQYSKMIFGDQALFVQKKLFQACGGFPEQSFLEDVAMSLKLKRLSKSACIQTPVRTSSRRFFKWGILKTYAKMTAVTGLYYLGANPEKLKGFYHGRN